MLQNSTVYASRREITELFWKLNILALVSFLEFFPLELKLIDPVVKKC